MEMYNMDNDLKKKIGWYIITIIGTLIPLLSAWFLTLGLEAGYVIAMDLILAETMGFVYYIIKKSFGIETNGG